MSAQVDPQAIPEEALQDLQVRVVQLSELGAGLARRAPAAPPEVEVSDPAPVRAAAPAAAAPARTAPASPASPASTATMPTPAAESTALPRSAPAAMPSATRPAAGNLPQAIPRAAPSAARRSDPLPQEQPRRRVFTVGRVFFVAVAVALYLGWRMPTERYITPKRGLGYALGIIGGSLMLLLLVYSLRKRWSWLRFLGPTPGWFRFHMVLGILGPLCILFHANFSTGATNSNVALFCMLIVASSGLVGRYIYTRIHHGLYGRKLELVELQDGAAGLRALSGNISFLPELVTRIEAAEQRLLRCGPRGALLGIVKPFLVALTSTSLRWRLHRYVRSSLRAVARNSSVVAAERKKLRSVACAYVDRRLAASRRVAGFEGYERLFSLWHALHIPLIFMMIIAAVIHVIAVHVY